MVSFVIKKVIAVWSLCLLGGMGDVPEPELPEMDGCPKWFAVIKNQGLPVCGGALITHIMAITGCECVSAQYEEFVIRRPVAYYTIRIEQTKAEVDVDMIVPHPMCELNTTEFPKFGTALVKAAWAISLDPKTVMPAPLYTLMLESEFEQFGVVMAQKFSCNAESRFGIVNFKKSEYQPCHQARFTKLLSMAVVKCGVMVKPLSGLGSSSKAKCRYEDGVESYMDVKLYLPSECPKYCLQAFNTSCPKDMADYDMYCLRVLSGGAKSYDPVPGTPLVCEDRVWGLMAHFHHDIDDVYFFYGIRSVVEIYSMAVTFSVGDDCGGNKIVFSKMRSRRVAADAVNLHSYFALTTVLLVILCTNYFLN